MQLEINDITKTVTVGEVTKSITVTNNEGPDTIVIEQPVVNAITVIHPGPIGPAGPPISGSSSSPISASKGLTKTGNTIELGGVISSSAILNLAGAGSFRVFDSNNGGFYVSNDDNSVAMATSQGSFFVNTSNGQFAFSDDRGATAKGIVYAGDYSLNYVSRSIPDTEWVDTKISSSIANLVIPTGSSSGSTDTSFLPGVVSASFHNTVSSSFGVLWDINNSTNDYLSISLPSNFNGNSNIIDYAEDTLIYGFVYAGINTVGLQMQDPNLNFTSYLFTSASLGTNYTGDPVPTSCLAFFIHPSTGLLYYTGNDNNFYIFDPINFINVKKVLGGTIANTRKILYDVNNERLAIFGTNGLARYDINTDTTKLYQTSTGNYTGTILPTLGFTQADIVDDVVFMGRSFSLSPSSDGLYRFNLTTEVSTLFTSTDGLSQSKVSSVVANGIYVYLAHNGSTASPTLTRFDSTNNSCVIYGNSTGNYSGSLLPASTLSSLQINVENQIMMAKTSLQLITIKIDGSNNLTVQTHDSAIGWKYSVSNFRSLLMRRIYLDSPTQNLVFVMSSTTGNFGLQHLMFFETNPIKITFDRYGLNYIPANGLSIDGHLLAPFSIPYTSYVNGLTTTLSQSISSINNNLWISPTFVSLSNGDTLQPTPSIQTIYTYSGSSNISVNLQLNQIAYFKINFIQRGSGSITINNGGGLFPLFGKKVTTAQYDTIEIIPSFVSSSYYEFVGR
jgi:hypothetical protein